MSERQNWWQLSTVQIGGVICLPVIMVGQALSQNYGFSSAIAAIVIGNAVLLLLGMVMAVLSHEKRKTTMETAADFFDATGTRFFAFAMGFSLVCWFAIQLNMMALGLLDLLSFAENREFWRVVFNTALGILITFAALYGIKGFRLLANISLPLLLFTLTYAFFTLEIKEASRVHSFTFGGASLVIALAIALVTDLPTYFRHARERKDGMLSILVIFGAVLPLLEVLGVYLSLGADEGSILDTLKRGEDSLWNIWIALFLILAGWTTNNINLYSGAMCLQSIFKGKTERGMTLAAGAVGTLLSYFDLLSHLEFTLDLIGIFIAGMGAVIITTYAGTRLLGVPEPANASVKNLCGWCVGIAFGWLGMQGYSLTTIPVLDAVIGASFGTAALSFSLAAYEKA